MVFFKSDFLRNQFIYQKESLFKRIWKKICFSTRPKETLAVSQDTAYCLGSEQINIISLSIQEKAKKISFQEHKGPVNQVHSTCGQTLALENYNSVSCSGFSYCRASDNNTCYVSCLWNCKTQSFPALFKFCILWVFTIRIFTFYFTILRRK